MAQRQSQKTITMTTEIRKLSIKDMIFIAGVILGIAGTYFKVQFDVDSLKKDNIRLSNSLDEYNNKLDKYSGLPRQIQDVEKTVDNNAKMLRVIHDGLVAKGIIAPRTD